jgi:sugar lactone lactonase YvrE
MHLPFPNRSSAFVPVGIFLAACHAAEPSSGTLADEKAIGAGFDEWSYGAIPDVVEVIDVAVANRTVFVVGFDGQGEGTVQAISQTTGATAEIYTGFPLLVPSGIDVSQDGSTVYVSDVASESSDGQTSGGVYKIDMAGTLTEIAAGKIDLPGDVTVSQPQGNLYVSGISASGTAAIYRVKLSTGATTTRFAGSPLVDPLQLDVSKDGSTLYVLDSMAGSGKSAVYALSLSSPTKKQLSAGFDIDFPGGLTAGTTGSDAAVYYTNSNGGDLVEVTTGGAVSVVDTMGMLTLPGGIATAKDKVFVADKSGGSSDLYLLAL